MSPSIETGSGHRITGLHSCRKWFPIFLLIAGCLAALPTRAQELQILELHHRFADEIIPAIQPLIEPGGTLTGSDNQLILRVSPGNLAQIRQAVAALDRAPRQLLITAGQGTVTSVDAGGVRGGVTVRRGDDRVDVQAGARSQQENLKNVSSVQTLEGNETLISIGTSTGYQSAATGFYATARLNGDQVLLEISPRQQSFSSGARIRQGAVVNSSGATTTVTGRLGEWIELGAVQQTGGAATQGLLIWGRRTASSRYSAWVRVEETTSASYNQNLPRSE